MGVFNKKKAKSEEQKTESSKTEEPTGKTEEKKEKELTPEEKREVTAQVIQLKHYPDNGQVVVVAVQNVTTQSAADFIIGRAKDDKFKADVARLTVIGLIETIARKKKGNNIIVPGGR